MVMVLVVVEGGPKVVGWGNLEHQARGKKGTLIGAPGGSARQH